MEKIFGVVILYHPDEEIHVNIQSYLPYIERLMVVDNSESISEIQFSEISDKIIFISDGENKGIAERLNMACEWAIKNNATWLLTMDQDSNFSYSNITTYLTCFNHIQDVEHIAMIGVTYERESQNINFQYEETDMLITSGSLVNLRVFNKIGGFDEKLFIDEVDTEYCLKAKVKGFKTVKLKNIYLLHTLGIVHQYRSLKNGKKSNRTIHSPIRIYYMVRNFLYVRKKYSKQLPDDFNYRKNVIINRIKNNFLYGKDRLKLLKYISKAYIDFKNDNFGKLKE